MDFSAPPKNSSLWIIVRLLYSNCERTFHIWRTEDDGGRNKNVYRTSASSSSNCLDAKNVWSRICWRFRWYVSDTNPINRKPNIPEYFKDEKGICGTWEEYPFLESCSTIPRRMPIMNLKYLLGKNSYARRCTWKEIHKAFREDFEIQKRLYRVPEANML